MVKMKVGQLKHVPELYPRLQVDQDHVLRMVDALEAGEELPPPVVDQRGRIVDGNHRAVAFGRVLGENAEIDCLQKTYKTDGEFFLDAIKLNGAHGLAMSPRDRQRAIEIADELKIDPKRCALALRMSVKAVGELAVRQIADTTVSVKPMTTKAFNQNGRPVFNPGKRRADFVKRIYGIASAIERGDVQPDDEEVMTALTQLHDVYLSLIAGKLPKGVGQSGPTFRKLAGSKPVGRVLATSRGHGAE